MVCANCDKNCKCTTTKCGVGCKCTQTCKCACKTEQGGKMGCCKKVTDEGDR